MRNFLDKSCIKTNILCSTTFSSKIMHLWDTERYRTTRQATDNNTIWLTHFECWMTTTTDTHLEYAILITFPWQQLFNKCAGMLHFACLVGILWCNPNGTCINIYELALSKINELVSAVILQKKNRKGIEETELTASYMQLGHVMDILL
jgi:hypothetical protein